MHMKFEHILDFKLTSNYEICIIYESLAVYRFVKSCKGDTWVCHTFDYAVSVVTVEHMTFSG